MCSEISLIFRTSTCSKTFKFELITQRNVPNHHTSSTQRNGSSRESRGDLDRNARVSVFIYNWKAFLERFVEESMTNEKIQYGK